MKKITSSILIIFAISVMACKKDVADCESNNYGTLKITYGLSNYRHSIIITPVGTSSSREKITAIGINSDTLHLAPASYSINISSINADGLAIDSQNGTSTITQCDVTANSVSF